MKLWLLIAAIPFVGLAQSPADFMTAGVFNCRGWNVMTNGHRGVYLAGSIEVLVSAISRLFPSAEAEEKIKKFLPYHYSREEMQKAVDRSCSDPANGILPLSEILAIEASKAEGAKPQEIENRLADSRKVWLSVIDKK